MEASIRRADGAEIEREAEPEALARTASPGWPVRSGREPSAAREASAFPARSGGTEAEQTEGKTGLKVRIRERRKASHDFIGDSLEEDSLSSL